MKIFNENLENVSEGQPCLLIEKISLKYLEVWEKLLIFAADYLLKPRIDMETTKKRTREEVRAAFKEAMRKKQEWIEESNAFLEQIQQKRQAGLI